MVGPRSCHTPCVAMSFDSPSESVTYVRAAHVKDLYGHTGVRSAIFYLHPPCVCTEGKLGNHRSSRGKPNFSEIK